MIKKIIYNILQNNKGYWLMGVICNTINTFFVTAIYILSVRLVIYFYHNSNTINQGDINFRLNISYVLIVFFALVIFIYLSNFAFKFAFDKINNFLISFKSSNVDNWEMFQSRLLKIIFDIPIIFILGIVLFFMKFQFAILVYCIYLSLFTIILFDKNKLINNLDFSLIRSFLDISSILLFILMALFFNMFDFKNEILACLICVFGTRLSNALFISSTNCLKKLKKQLPKIKKFQS